MHQQKPMPRLAFGESHANHDRAVGGLLAAQRLAHRSLRAYDPIGSSGDFRQKSATVTFGGLRLVASAHTPVRVVVDASDDYTLLVPFSEWSTAVIEGRTHRWSAGRSAMYLPGVPRQGESGRRSTLAIGMEAARLRRFGKLPPDAQAVLPEAHESLISPESVADVPLTGLSIGPNYRANISCRTSKTRWAVGASMRPSFLMSRVWSTVRIWSSTIWPVFPPNRQDTRVG